MEISTKSYSMNREMSPGRDVNNLHSVHSERLFVFKAQACAMRCISSGYRLKLSGRSRELEQRFA
jgi:hypothetical protein